jgi:hypothetical protein
MFKIDWTTSSDIYNYSKLNSEYNWEDLCIQFNKHTLLIAITKLEEVRFCIRFLHMFHCKYSNAT